MFIEPLESRELLAGDGYRVVIDPGHGGTVDVGGSGANHATGVVSGVKEKDFALDMARQVRELLANNGYEVALTRDADVNLSLEDRARAANDFNADFFLAIHYNGDEDPTVRGTEVFVRSAADNANLAADRAFATHIQDAVVAAIPGGNIRSGSPKEAGFGVLYDGWLASAGEDPVVSAYLETEFISNVVADQYVASPEGRNAIAQAIAEAIELSRRDLFRVSDIQLDAAAYSANVGQTLTYTGRLVDADGQPRAGVTIGIEDGVTSSTRTLGVTDAAGRFSWTYSAAETTAAGPGYFTATLIADGGAVTETIGLSLLDPSLMSIPLDGLRLAHGPLGPPTGVLEESLPFTPVEANWQTPGPTLEAIRHAASVAISGLFEGARESITDPAFVGAAVLAGVSCLLPDPTLVTKAVCVQSLNFASKTFVANAGLGVVHAAIDDWADRNQIDDVAREDAHNIVLASETLWAFARFKPQGGIRRLDQALDAAQLAIDVPEAIVELGKDAYGRLTEVRVIAPAASGGGDTLAFAFGVGDDPPPHVEQTSPAHGEVLTGGPNEILIRWSEAMDQAAGLLSADDLDLAGPGLGTAHVTSARWADSRTAAFTIDGSWGEGRVAMEVFSDDLRDLSSQPSIDFLNGEFTISSNVELAAEPFNAPRSATIGRSFAVATPITNYSPQASPRTTVRYELIDASGSATFLADMPLSPITARTTYMFTPTLRAPSNLAPGGYTVRATIDPQQSLPERRRDDNVRSSSRTTTFSAASSGPTDLTPRSFSIPAVGTIGGSVPIQFTAHNVSSTDAPASFVRVTIPSSPPIDLGLYSMPAIRAGESLAQTVRVSIPPTVAAGSYSMRIELNADRAFPEMLTANNSATSPTTIALETPTTSRPNLRPTRIAASANSVAAGGSITVDVVVENVSLGASGDFDATFLVSANPRIDFADAEIVTVRRNGLAAGRSDSWTQTLAIPASFATGSYFIGVDVDRGSDLPETNEFDNWKVTANAVTVTPAVSTSRLTSVGLQVRDVAPVWGDTLTVANNLRNDGDGVYGGGTLEFLLSDSVSFPAASTLVRAARPVSQLTPGRSSGANTPLPLPATKPASFSGTTAYVGLRLDGQVIDRVSVSIGDPPPPTPVNVHGVDFDISPINVVGWGGLLTTDLRFRNSGSLDAENFQNAIYLSHDATFDPTDVRVHHYDVPRIVAGRTLGRREAFSLPRTPPAGFSAAQTVYVLHVSDDRDDLAEGAGEADNSGLGNGIDSRQITVTTNPPPGDDPVIGTFTLSHSAVPRGTKVDVTLTGVVDNSGVVNDVHIFDDANGNGQLDPTDPRITGGVFYLSRLGDRFTGRLDTSILAVGSHTLMAVAEDNYANWSTPAFATIDVQGVGTAVPDRFEANETRATAHFVGTGPVIVEDHLSITPGDVDWISFANYSDANLRVRIDFYEEDGFPVAPGDLYLQLYRNGSNSSYGFSNRSTAGATYEEITRTNLPGGLFHVGIAAQGAGNSNDDYKLTIELTSPAGYPTSGGLTLSATDLRPTSTLTATLNNVQTFGGSTVDGVVFYADINRDYSLDVNNEFLGWGERVWDSVTLQWTNHYEWSGPVSNWGIGEVNVIAFPIDSSGRPGLSFDQPVVIRQNVAPSLTSLVAPTNVTLGDSFDVTASGFTDPDGASPNVRFQYDSDGDGAPDTTLAGTKQTLSDGVRLTVDSTPLGAGTFVISAVPTDGIDDGPALTTTVTIDPPLPPSVLIGGITSPAAVIETQSFVVRAAGVLAPSAPSIDVRVFADANHSGELEPNEDTLLSIAQPLGGDGFEAALGAESLVPGVAVFFVQASASGFSPAVESFGVNVLPNRPPTAIELSNRTVAEDADTRNGLTLATLRASDNDGPRDGYTFQLAAGIGDDDNRLFEIAGDQLRLRPSASLDYETRSQLQVRLAVTDGDAVLTQNAVIDVTDVVETLTVVRMTAGASGVRIDFSEPLDVARLNLYDGQDASIDLPDATLVGASTGPVRMSMIVSPDGRSIEFVPFAGRLAADDYTLTLASRADAFTTAAGDLLDGDADGQPGGDSVHAFTIAAPTGPSIHLPNIARGPGQTIDLAGSGGIPISITGAAGVTSLSATFEFDPALMEVTAVELSSGAPNDWAIQTDSTSPGRVQFSASGSTGLGAGTTELIRVRARVPSSAAIGAAQTIRLIDVVRDGGESLDDASAVHAAAYFGDVTGNGDYSALDASRVARVATALDTGFDPFDRIDPRIIADVTGNGELSAFDASFIARKAAGLPQPEIPDLPASSTSFAAFASFPASSPIARAGVDEELLDLLARSTT